MPVDKVTSTLHGESSIQKDMQASLSLFRSKAAVLNQGLQPQRVQGDSSDGRPNMRCKPYTLFFFFPVPVCAITASGVPGGTFVSMNRFSTLCG
jgi:hypothetical protein